jgi:CubicO group peptidase (beta-lactamase class C family)
MTSATHADQIGEVLRTTVDDGQLVGVAATAWSRSEVIFEGAVGDAAPGRAMQPDSIMFVASLTKAVTAAAVMQLVESGTLTLNQPVGELFPYLDEVQVLVGFDAEGNAILRAPTRRLTLLHLLTHTSGFGYSSTDGSLARYVKTVPETVEGSQSAYELPLVFDPGERWEYGLGLNWAGRIVEEASGQRLDEYFNDHIFGPLGMPDTSFLPNPALRQRVAAIYQRTEGALVPYPIDLPTEIPEMFDAGGGLYSTAVDFARFTRMLLGGGALNGVRVLEPSTVELMAQDHLDGLQVTGWSSFNPVVTNDVRLLEGQNPGWGLSFLRNSMATAEGRSPGSLFWGGIANCYYWIDLDAGITGVFATQVLPFYDAGALSSFASFERAVYGAMSKADLRSSSRQ